MQWLSQYGYLIIVFVILAAAFAFLFVKAAGAYSNHNKRYKEQEAQLKRLTALKEKYRNASVSDLDSFDSEEILEGTALLYQIALQKNEDMEAAFSTLEAEKKYVYTLDVFCEDASAKVFFSQNSEILTGIILQALTEIGMSDFAEELSVIAKMFDKNDEDVSYSEKALEDFDKMMAENNILTGIKLNSAKYIKENYNILKN